MSVERIAILYARLALGSAFLSAVAARLGLWRDRGPGAFAEFIAYTGEVNSFLPPATYPFLAVAATVAETILGISLIAGIRLKWSALASSILLALFGTAMAISFGIKSPLDASVFSASAGALILHCFDRHRCRSLASDRLHLPEETSPIERPANSDNDGRSENRPRAR